MGIMMTSPFLTLCLVYLLGPIANFGWAIPPIHNQLKEMTTAIQPSFSNGLVDLCNLFDLVMNHDEKIGSLNYDNGTMLPIQRAIQSASNWLNKTEAISNYHMQMYDADLLSLSSDIYAKDSQLQRYTMELQTLTNEMTEWKTKAAELIQEISDHAAQVGLAESFVKSSESKLVGEGNLRAMTILVTIFTAGLLLPVLITSELELAEAKRQIEKWRNEGERVRELLQIAIKNLHDAETRQQTSEESIKKMKTNFLSMQTKRKLLRTRYATWIGLGVQIRNISTFASLLNGEIVVLHSQHQLMVVFRPLLESIDSLVNFLEDNANILVLIADRDAVTKIRRHFGKTF